MDITLAGTSPYATISAMIAPALFLTANGSLIISTSNRINRVSDRTRALNELCDDLCRGSSDLDYPLERFDLISDNYFSRSAIIRIPGP